MQAFDALLAAHVPKIERRADRSQVLKKRA
jgi:hypothetical protein